LLDPFAEKKSPWPKVLVLVGLLLLTYVVLSSMGYIYDWTNGRLGDRKPSIEKPATTAPAPAKKEAEPPK